MSKEDSLEFFVGNKTAIPIATPNPAEGDANRVLPEAVVAPLLMLRL